MNTPTSFSRLGPVLLAATALGSLFACGSDSATSPPGPPTTAGSGGAAGRAGGGSGGTSAGRAGSAGASGSAGAAGGAAGAAGQGGSASGSAGENAGGSTAGAAGLGGTDAGGSAGAAGTGAGEGGAAGSSGSGGTAGSAGSGGGETGLFVGENGSDTAAGTEAEPFKTLTHAASVAKQGQTITFLDGTFKLGNTTIKIPDGVNLQAKNAGKANLIGVPTAIALELAGITTVQGLVFTDAQRALRFAGGATASGALTIKNTSFVNCSISCLELSGTTTATVESEAGAVLGNGGNGFASLTQSSKLTIIGGTLQNYGSGNALRASDTARVTLTNVEAKGGTGIFLNISQDVVADVTGLKSQLGGQAAFATAGASELTVKDSDVGMNNGLICFSLIDAKKLTLQGTKVHGCGTGLKGAVPSDLLRLVDTEFYGLGFGGADLDSNGSRTVEVEGCSFREAKNVALRVGASLLRLKMRKTSIDIQSDANWHALILQGNAASEVDLGTLADPGGNTFLQRSQSLSSAIVFQLNGVPLVQAVGNTWTPNVQGAGATGTYAVTTGKVYEDTAAAEGRNFRKQFPSMVLRLAEIP